MFSLVCFFLHPCKSLRSFSVAAQFQQEEDDFFFHDTEKAALHCLSLLPSSLLFKKKREIVNIVNVSVPLWWMCFFLMLATVLSPQMLYECESELQPIFKVTREQRAVVSRVV